MSEEGKDKNNMQNQHADTTVNGYCFQSVEDATLARQEIKKIEYLQEHIDYQDTQMLFGVYQKALENRTFRTPIGQNYLHNLRRVLVKEGLKDEEIPPVILYHNYTEKKKVEVHPVKKRIEPAKKKEKADKFMISVLLNICLALLVIGMFAVAYTSEHPNILNYERVIVDKYASWEQDLTEREDAFREKELQLNR